MSMPPAPIRSLKYTSLSFLFACTLVGCSTDDVSRGQLTLLVGQETNAWTVKPAAATVQVDMVQAGVHTSLATEPAPPGVITLGDGGPDAEVSFEATAFDAQNNPVMHGVSSGVSLQGFDEAALFVFLGRSGFSRPVGALQYEHHHPQLTVWPNAYLLISGGDTAGSDPTQLDVLDIAVSSLVADAPAFPQAANGSAAVGTQVLLVGDTMSVWFDLVYTTSSPATPPPGLAFSEVSGGQTLQGPDGTQYLVGATRASGTPTDKVLQVNPDGTLATLVLSEPRLGAAAAMVEGNLVVVGGSASGAGGEQLAAGTTSFAPLSLPADETEGAGLAELTPTSLIIAGGHDATTGAASATRSIDLSCTDTCTATEIADLDLTLTGTRAFALSANRVLVVGDADDGQTHAFTLDVSGASPVSTEQVFREARSGASAALLANGQVAVAGGDDPSSGSAITSVELFFP